MLARRPELQAAAEKSSGPITAALARFAINTRWNDLPDQVRQAAVQNVLNIAGCSLGGSGTPMVEQFLAEFGGSTVSPHATVIGRREKLDMENASFLNCATAAVYAYVRELTQALRPQGAAA